MQTGLQRARRRRLYLASRRDETSVAARRFLELVKRQSADMERTCGIGRLGMNAGGAARRETYDPAHWPRGIGLRQRSARPGGHRGSARNQLEK